MITIKPALAVMAAIAVLVSVAYSQPSRDRILIVGSSTVYPLAITVAEHFSKATGFKSPEIQSTGTGGGLKLFCAGAGAETPDIANASRRMEPTEVQTCEKNGVKEIVEIKFGYDAIVVAGFGAKRFPNLTRKELFLALAKQVPDPDGARLVPNPYKTWKEINPTFPDSKIQVWGPEATHGTYDLILSHIMTAGCRQFDFIDTLGKSDPAAFKAACQTFRGDGAYTEVKEYDAGILALKNNPELLGILGYTLVIQNPTLLTVSIDGVEPTFGSIAHRTYPLTRPLFFYVKKAHLDTIPGLKEYLAEFTSEAALGASNGYLFNKGMIPMPLGERKQTQGDAQQLKPLSL